MAKPKRVSATVPAELVAFLEEYQQIHQLDSRSTALAEAIRALREREALSFYEELGEAQVNGAEKCFVDSLNRLKMNWPL